MADTKIKTKFTRLVDGQLVAEHLAAGIKSEREYRSRPHMTVRFYAADDGAARIRAEIASASRIPTVVDRLATPEDFRAHPEAAAIFRGEAGSEAP